MRHIISQKGKEGRPNYGPRGKWACLARCGMCVLTIEEERGLLFFEATESSATTHRLKTSNVSSSVQ